MKENNKGFLFWMVLVMLFTNNLVVRVISTTTPTSGTKFVDLKNFNSPDPHVLSGHGSNRQSDCITPSIPIGGGIGGGSGDPGSGGGSSGSGSGGYYPTPSPPIGGGGSGGYYPTPSPPKGGGGSGGYYPTPSPSKGGGGGGHHHPPKHVPINPPKGGGGCACPTPPLVSSPPPASGGSGGYYPPTPTTPVIVTPSSPLVPSPPIIPIVTSPPFAPTTPLTPFDPNNPPFPCNFWGTHPQLIFGVLGWWATLGGLWGVTTLPGLSSTTSLQQVLLNTKNDGYGSLYREGTAALLNSMAATKVFPFSTKQVKDSFLASLDSDKTAASQARLFKLANERKLKHFVANP